jgi:hypothetical protein
MTPPDDLADLAEVCRLLAAGRPVTDPELNRRIEERSRAVRQDILRTHGVVEVAVDLIRETRHDE